MQTVQSPSQQQTTSEKQVSTACIKHHLIHPSFTEKLPKYVYNVFFVAFSPMLCFSSTIKLTVHIYHNMGTLYMCVRVCVCMRIDS